MSSNKIEISLKDIPEIIEILKEKEADIRAFSKENYYNKLEIERLNNIINEIEKELDLNLPFKVIGVRGLKNKIKELKENK